MCPIVGPGPLIAHTSSHTTRLPPPTLPSFDFVPVIATDDYSPHSYTVRWSGCYDRVLVYEQLASNSIYSSFHGAAASWSPLPPPIWPLPGTRSLLTQSP